VASHEAGDEQRVEGTDDVGVRGLLVGRRHGEGESPKAGNGVMQECLKVSRLMVVDTEFLQKTPE
jgi:hypothetical protein